MFAAVSAVDWPLVLGSLSAVVLFLCSVILVAVVAHRKGISDVKLHDLTGILTLFINISFVCVKSYFLSFFSFHPLLKLKQQPRKRRRGIVFLLLISFKDGKTLNDHWV